ncbi:hypothetical protein KDW36_17575 [Burkholderia dolosa]|nr:hypothetical protein [Burkholderia dolosa]
MPTFVGATAVVAAGAGAIAGADVGMPSPTLTLPAAPEAAAFGSGGSVVAGEALRSVVSAAAGAGVAAVATPAATEPVAANGELE